MSRFGLLHFRERFYPRIWGGNRLRELFGKAAPQDESVGEAWLASDHPGDESIVDEGPHSGKTLQDLMAIDGEALLGTLAKPTPHGRFPLLLKLLDANDWLSVQVHPDDETAASLDEPDAGKTEMWHVLEAEEGAELICGLEPEVTRELYLEAVAQGELEQCMVRFRASAGTSVFVAAGTVHAIGAGIVLAEIQQNSDLTYRIHDWGRLQDDGKPRELHTDKAARAIHFGSPHAGPAIPLKRQENGVEIAVLAACRYFAAERIRTTDSAYERNTRGASFHLVLAKSHELRVWIEGGDRVLKRGEAALVPADALTYRIERNAEGLIYYVPDLRTDVMEPLRAAGALREDIVRLGGDAGHSDLGRLPT